MGCGDAQISAVFIPSHAMLIARLIWLLAMLACLYCPFTGEPDE